jgi:hypothetical protein
MWICLLASAVSFAASDKAVYPPQKIRARGLERIEITGVKGHLKLVGTPGHVFRLKVGHSKRHSEDWNLLVERRGKTLVLEVSNSALGREWRRQVKRDQWPEFDLELDGPPLPTVVSWREGRLEYAQWTNDVETSFWNGKVSIDGGRGNYRLQALAAQVAVRDFKGDLTVRGEAGEVTLNRVDANTDLNWLSGTVRVENTGGNVHLEGRALDTTVNNGRGEWELELAGGQTQIRDFNGKLKARGKSTKWILSGARHSEIELLNASGPVDVDWKAPAKVFLTSVSGAIHSPYAVKERDGQRVAEGKKAGKPAGQLFVRTDSGDIRFKH